MKVWPYCGVVLLQHLRTKQSVVCEARHCCAETMYDVYGGPRWRWEPESWEELKVKKIERSEERLLETNGIADCGRKGKEKLKEQKTESPTSIEAVEAISV